MMLLHGIAKLMGGVGGISKMLEGLGMPAAFAYAVFIGEVIAPVLVIVGVWTRLGAALMAINMIVAVLLAHGAELFTLGRTGGWALELQGFFFFTAVALVLMGAGRYSVGGLHGRWN
ncbi:MAG TPA: DoxX family protein [Albitalea sp.]